MGLRIHGELDQCVESPRMQKDTKSKNKKSAVQDTKKILYKGSEHAETVCVLLQEDLPSISKEKYPDELFPI